MSKSHTIEVKGTRISILQQQEKDYISLTDMVKGFQDGGTFEKWLRNKNTIEFIGIWEQLNNPDFNSPELEGIKTQAESMNIEFADAPVSRQEPSHLMRSFGHETEIKFLFQNPDCRQATFTRNNEKETSSENKMVTAKQSDSIYSAKANQTFLKESQTLQL